MDPICQAETEYRKLDPVLGSHKKIPWAEVTVETSYASRTVLGEGMVGVVHGMNLRGKAVAMKALRDVKVSGLQVQPVQTVI